MNSFLKKLAIWLLIGWLSSTALYGTQEQGIILQANESAPYWSQKLPHGGMCGEIIEAISNETKLKTQIQFRPLKRLINDRTNNDLGNPEFFMVNQDFAAVIPIAVSYNAFFSYRPSKQNNQSGRERIGVLKGTVLGASGSPKVEESYSHESLFKKLKKGRIDLVLELQLVGAQTIAQLFPNEIEEFDARIIQESASPIAIMIDGAYPNGEEIGRLYKEGLHKIIKNGVYQQILSKYYKNSTVPKNWHNDLTRFESIYDK